MNISFITQRCNPTFKNKTTLQEESFYFIFRILKPDGVFIGGMFGGETLGN